MFFKGMDHPIESAQHTALEYAWRQLEFHPFDGGDGRVEFESTEGYVRGDWDAEIGDFQIIVTYRAYTGYRSQRTEEGHSDVSVILRPVINKQIGEAGKLESYEVTDEWTVGVSTTSSDCDGSYSGGHTVLFVDGNLPEVVREPDRDHRAEAAGY